MAPARPPSVEGLLAAARPRLRGTREHEALVATARAIVQAERARLAAGGESRRLADLAGDLLATLDGYVAGASGESPTSVINATGVIIHTNLGRAPWPAAAIEAARAAASEPILLEMDRASGRRGARFRLAEEHLVALTGAEDALITNNNAAALALAVGLAGRRGQVVVSRGELVEIGGGVRIPEIIRRVGARLIEVGTTNRTRVGDYEEALRGAGTTEQARPSGAGRLVLRVHPSNFRQTGFVESPDPAALAALAHRSGALVVDDLGSGALLPTERFGLAHEPTPTERLAAGADLVTFSGDKLIGGPQAGLIVGRAELVARLRRDPLARAARPDKTTLAAVAATLGLYRAGRAVAEIPVWRMIAAAPDELHGRAEAVRTGLGQGAATRAAVSAMASTVGGGSLPGETLSSWGLALDPGGHADALMARLRRGTPAVIGRVQDGDVLLDMRTIPPWRDTELGAAIGSALTGPR